MIEGALYDATWGSVRLWCSSLSTSHGRTQVVHELAEGDDHVVQDRGLAVRRVSASLLFIEMPSVVTTALDRLRTFIRQIDEGERLLFTHPVEGSYYVNVEDFSYDLDEDSEVATATATFVKSADADSPQESGAGTDSSTGTDAVEDASDTLNADLFEAGIASSLPSDAKIAQQSWADSEIVPTRQVINDVASMSDRLGALIEDEGLEHDLKLFDVYKSTIMMGAAIRSAALNVLASTPRLTSIRVGAPLSLLALCVSIYGGAEAESRYRQILDLNDVRTPGWLAAGITMTIPIPRAVRSAWSV